jgi:laccase
MHMHCHLDVHITWGLAMAFLVEDGIGELESLEAPSAERQAQGIINTCRF